MRDKMNLENPEDLVASVELKRQILNLFREIKEKIPGVSRGLLAEVDLASKELLIDPLIEVLVKALTGALGEAVKEHFKEGSVALNRLKEVDLASRKLLSEALIGVLQETTEKYFEEEKDKLLKLVDSAPSIENINELITNLKSNGLYYFRDYQSDLFAGFMKYLTDLVEKNSPSLSLSSPGPKIVPERDNLRRSAITNANKAKKQGFFSSVSNSAEENNTDSVEKFRLR